MALLNFSSSAFLLFKQSWPHVRADDAKYACLAGLPPGSLLLQISCLLPHHPPLYRKLACSQPMNMPINPLFEQYDLLRFGFPGVENTERGDGAFAIILISLDLCLLLDLFSLPSCLCLCYFVSLIHLFPQVRDR